MKRLSGGKRQVLQLKAVRKHWFGGKCMGEECEKTINLQLAHAVPTELSKKKNHARSSLERLIDVIENPESFILLCQSCHVEFDGKGYIAWWEYDRKVQINFSDSKK